MIGYRVVLFLLLPALLLLAAGIVMTQDFFGEQGVELGEALSETNGEALPDPRVYVEAEIFSDTTDPGAVYLALTQATLRLGDGQDEGEFFCLHGIYVQPSWEAAEDGFLPDAPYDGQYGEDELPAFRLDPPLCNFAEGENEINAESNSLVSDVITGPDEPLELFLDEGQQTIRFYPFDQQAGTWDIYPLALAPDGELRQDVGISVHLTAELVDWEERIALQPDVLRFDASPPETVAWPAEVLELELSRTWTQRLLTLMLLGLLTVLILGLIFVQEKSTLLEIAIGVLLGLWGIQAVLIPDTIQSRTLVHYWVIVLYILLGLVTYVRLVGLPLVSGDAAEAIASLDDEIQEELEEANDQSQV